MSLLLTLWRGSANMSKPKSTAATGSLGTQLALAGISNAAAAACTNPIDVVKVQLQMDGQGSASVGGD